MVESIDELPQTVEPVDDAHYSGTTFALGRGIELNLKHHDDEVSLRVYQCDDISTQYMTSQSRGWMNSDQIVRTVGNEIAYDLDLDEDWIKSRLRDVRQYVEVSDMEMLADDAMAILNRTEEVKAYQTPESLSVMVWLDAPPESPINGTQRITFDGVEEWRTDSADVLQNKHYHAFLTEATLADEDWQVIWERWQGDMTLEHTEAEGENEIISNRVMDVLRSRVSAQIYDFEDLIGNSEWHCYYESAEESEYDEPTVWVQSQALRQILDDETQQSSAGYMGTLSSTLARRDLKLAGSERRRLGGERVTVHPFRAEAVGVETEMQVTTREDLENDLDDILDENESGDGVTAE